jgi:hypothetical protein
MLWNNLKRFLRCWLLNPCPKCGKRQGLNFKNCEACMEVRVYRFENPF